MSIARVIEKRDWTASERREVISYSFKDSDGCYANCTLNTGEGELTISSTWGSWSYGWHHRGDKFIDFIASCPVDYLSDKLMHRDRYEFDGDTSVANIRSALNEYSNASQLEEALNSGSFLGLADNDSDEEFLTALYRWLKDWELDLEEPWNYTATTTTYRYSMMHDQILPLLIDILNEVLKESRAKVQSQTEINPVRVQPANRDSEGDRIAAEDRV